MKANKSEGASQDAEQQEEAPADAHSSESGDALVGGDDEGSEIQSIQDALEGPAVIQAEPEVVSAGAEAIPAEAEVEQ